MKKPTFEEVVKKAKEISDRVDRDSKEIRALGEKKKWSYFQLDESREKEKWFSRYIDTFRVYEAYGVHLSIDDFLTQLYVHPDKKKEHIENAKSKLAGYFETWKWHLTRDLRIEQVNAAKHQFKFHRSSYPVDNRGAWEYLDIDIDKAEVKSFQNGRVIIQLTPEQFEKVMEIVNVPFGMTSDVVTALRTEKEFRDKVLNAMDKKHMNEWAPIYDRFDGKMHNKNVNSFVIEQELVRLKKLQKKGEL